MQSKEEKIRKGSNRNVDFFLIFFFFLQHFASGHYESALLAICAGDAEDY